MSSTHRGSEAASARFEMLVMPHLASLLAFARHRTATEADAEDLVQEVCVRAWSGFDGLRDSGRARAWLFQILRRLLSDHHRVGARQWVTAEITSLEAAHEELIASEHPGPFEALLGRLSAERVRNALDQIPDEYAMAVALHALAGFQYREIAEILDVPLGTVMSRIHRGRKLLAGWIAADGSWILQAAVPAGTPGTPAKRVQP